ncbi:MAG TPA: hypothetical protein VLI68_13890 [Hanamia sp.]|jgi:hypothetical protein|nr:hypothetical protein [Hanamia sp.]
MSTFETIIIILFLVLLLAFIWILTEVSAMKKELDERKSNEPDILKLRLQAYERITLLTERIALQNLLSRNTNSGLTCRQMQMTLIDSIKQEYDYNISQQIYVSTEVWRAVNNLKEQNIYIINQLASTLPAQASGMDLNKHIVDYLINNSNASLHSIVLDAINFEAKKLM